MNVPNPIVYWFCLNAWEQYRRDEALPVRSLPALVLPDVGGGVHRLTRVLRLILSRRRPADRSERLRAVPATDHV